MTTLFSTAVRTETCEIREVGGRLLATGTIRLRTRNRAGEFVAVALDRPGELLQRCLVEGPHDVLVAVNGRPPEPAAVDRLTFTAEEGRVCVLCLPLSPPTDPGPTLSAGGQWSRYPESASDLGHLSLFTDRPEDVRPLR